MRHYIALIHEDPSSGYGLSFPDIPGVITAGDTLDDTLAQAAAVLAFAATAWTEPTGDHFPEPRSLDALRGDHEFLENSHDPVVAAIPFGGSVRQAA